MLLARLTRSSLPTAIRVGSRPLWRPYSTTWRPSYLNDPLRILFCGSDTFSCASLQALYNEQQRNGDLIQSIDVLVRTSKPQGRGNKFIGEYPVKLLAEKLKLPIHTQPTFTGWDLPMTSHGPINLIIAVSIGLFVPKRILSEAKYGGLNVHPSLLPDLKGAAPIQHALLNNYTHTGVTVQTLSSEGFDEGTPLLQTPFPGLPIPPDATYSSLHETLATEGAALLISALRQDLYLPALHPRVQTDDNTNTNTTPQGGPIRPAPKITQADRQIRWTTATAASVVRQARALGDLWTTIPLRRKARQPPEAHAILDELSVVRGPEVVAVGGGEGEKGDGGGDGEGQKQQQQQQQQKGEGDGNGTGTGTGEGERQTQQKQQKQQKGKGEGGKKEAERRTVTFIEKENLDPAGVKARFACSSTGPNSHLDIEMLDGSVLRVGKIKVEGSTFLPASEVAWRQAHNKKLRC